MPITRATIAAGVLACALLSAPAQAETSRFDSDGDGAMSRGELIEALKAVFDGHDGDGDGYLSPEELMGLSDAEDEETELDPEAVEAVLGTFMRFDVNRDGRISRAEARREADRRFVRMDANGDGRIAAGERAAPDGEAPAAPGGRDGKRAPERDGRHPWLKGPFER